MLKYAEINDGDTFRFTKGNHSVIYRGFVEDGDPKLFRKVNKGMEVTIQKGEKQNNPRYPGKTKYITFELKGEVCWAKWGDFRKITERISKL